MPHLLQMTIAVLVIQAMCTAAGVFHPKFEDNLIQRIGLAGATVCSLAIAWRYWNFGVALLDDEMFSYYAGAWTLYAVGTVWKVFKRGRL